MIQIAKAVDEEVVNRDLVPAFVKLLKDTEAEVRSAIAGQIPGKFLFIQHLHGSGLMVSKVSVHCLNVIRSFMKSCRA